MNKPHSLPFSWQRALVAYALQTGVTLYSNSVLWGHIDSLNHPYAFWLKAGLLGIVDLTGYVLVTWHLFARVPATRAACFAMAAILMLVVLIHTGGVAGYEGSKTENLQMIEAMADGQAKIAQAQTEAQTKANNESAMKANQLGQRNTARRIISQGQQSVAGANADAQKAFLEKAEAAKPHSFLPEGYMNGAMYWALMALAGFFLMTALWVTEKSGHQEDANHNGIPDALEGFVGHPVYPAQPQPVPVVAAPPVQPEPKLEPKAEKPRAIWQGGKRIDEGHIHEPRGNGADRPH